MIIIDNNNVACDVIRFLLAIRIDWFFSRILQRPRKKKKKIKEIK